MLKKGQRFRYVGQCQPAWHDAVWVFSHYNECGSVCCSPGDTRAWEIFKEEGSTYWVVRGWWNLCSEGDVRVCDTLFDVEETCARSE
jgi:hypothetical protein